jgi:sterol desaturase/sphingolipid hydroxylase (fatty acid hydroxylase superfamily)
VIRTVRQVGPFASREGPDTTAATARRPPVLRAALPRCAPVLLGLVIVTAFVYGTVSNFHSGGGLSGTSFTGVWQGWKDVVLNPWFAAFLVVLALLQWRFPARRDNRSLSAGGAQDLFWFVLSPIRDVTVIAVVLTALGAVVDALSGGRQADLVPAFGVVGVAVLAFVVGDFAAWLSHVMHHNVVFLWQFHAVHHSQRQMNMLTDNREHIVETIINVAVVFVPARLLGLDSEAAGTLAFLSIYLAAMIHANIRTNLGPLRFVLVSPQYHRVHHSVYREHYNVNYGSVFSCWDYIFRTRFRDQTIYPPTGIDDLNFPVERSAHVIAVVRTWWRQTVYPFSVVASQVAARRVDASSSTTDGLAPWPATAPHRVSGGTLPALRWVTSFRPNVDVLVEEGRIVAARSVFASPSRAITPWEAEKRLSQTA